jgi:hypothetical protein
MEDTNIVPHTLQIFKPPSPGEWEELSMQEFFINDERYRIHQPEHRLELFQAGMTEQEVQNLISARELELRARMQWVRSRVNEIDHLIFDIRMKEFVMVMDHMNKACVHICTATRQDIALQKQKLEEQKTGLNLNKPLTLEEDLILHVRLCDINARIWEMDIPSDIDINYGLTHASSEVKYVLGVLGFTTREFVVVTVYCGNENCATFDQLFNEKLREHSFVGMSKDVFEKLEDFAVWYECFLEAYNREPEIVETDFNDNVWRSFLWGIRKSPTYSGYSGFHVPGTELQLIERATKQYAYESLHVTIPVKPNFAFRVQAHKETNQFYLYQF